MKRKISILLLLLTMVFAVGCNKENKQPDPTPTTAAAPTQPATPTPIPENLAKTNLGKLLSAYDTMLSQQPDYVMDYSNGIGYDMKMDLTLNETILGILGLADLGQISIDGSLDYKDTFAGKFALFLNQDEIIDVSVLTDFNNVFFNLPKYSSLYAGATMAELTGTEEEFPLDMSEIPTNAELYDMLRTYLSRFVECFEPQTDIVNNATIGTGDYVITGDKYTVIAPKEDILKLLEDLETELSFGLEDLAADTESSTTEESESSATCLILNYYAGANNSYAWEILTDSPDSEPVVYVSTTGGFCFYGLSEGTPEIIVYSIATTENEGTLFIPGEVEEGAEEAEILGEMDYEYDDNSFAIEGYLDTIELVAEYSIKNDTIEFEYEMEAESITITMEETASKDHVDAEISLALDGIRLGTLTMTADIRDYAEVPVPQDAVDIDTWAAQVDQMTLISDLMTLLEKYPFLMDLLLGSEEDPEYDDPAYSDPAPDTREPYAIPEGYTDEFMGMTGYFVDADGYVDFTPLEAEVLAAGKPSTGFASAAVTDAQKQALLDLCAGLFADYYYDVENYYSVWGSLEWDMVESYYQTEHYFSDNDDYNSFIFLNFDAVSGDFVDISIYTSSSEKSIQVANDVLAILGVDGTVTAEDLANYVVVGNYLLYGYGDETTYGVGIEVYEDYE